MITDAKDLISQLNSPLDWFIVIGAGTVGLVADGVFNVVGAPFFTPGTCAVTAATAAFGVKKGVSAWSEARRSKKLSELLYGEANRCVDMLVRDGKEEQAENYLWELRLLTANSDQSKLVSIVERLRRDVGTAKASTQPMGIIWTSDFRSKPE